MIPRFVPTHPPRRPKPVASWRGLIGERARTAVYGWSELAFETDHIRRRVLGFNVHVLLTPEAVQRVLLDNAANYPKPGIVKSLLAPIIGQGLLTADGELWREQRRIVAASFTPSAIQERRALFAAAALRTMEGWSEGEVRDLAAESTRTTMLIIAEALFGGDPRLTSREAMAHIAAALAGFSQPRLQALAGLPIIPIGRKAKAGRRGQLYLRETLGTLVADRVEVRVPDKDFLGLLIRALRERFPAEQAVALAVDNAATFYLAGHETTANALAWTLYLLSEQPELQEELAGEASGAIASDWQESPTTDSLPRLYAFLQESMRLYPPVPRFDRQATAADRLGEAEIQPGDIVSIWPWLLHRHRRLWDDPDAFVADRFAGKRERHRFQYLPFGGGSRTCVGAHFATVEALTLLALWLANWRFVSIGQAVRVSGLVTLRPVPGVLLRLERR